MPEISVVIPVYNGEKYLKEAIDSILNQTFRDFELILINDASKDGSESIIDAYDDERIRHIRNEENIGLAETLNIGIRESRGNYLARMDQDDISLPKRLEIQLEAFKKDDALVICGSQFTMFNGLKNSKSNYPAKSEDVFTNMLFYNCVAHPTVMIKLSEFRNHGLHYDKMYDWAEDYELWTRARHLVKIENVNQQLLNYRINEGSMTASSESRVQKTMKRIYSRSLLELGIKASEKVLDLHMRIGHFMIKSPNEEELSKIETHLINILEANEKVKIYDKKILTEILRRRWNLNALGLNDKETSDFFSRELSQKIGVGNYERWNMAKRFLKNRIYNPLKSH